MTRVLQTALLALLLMAPAWGQERGGPQDVRAAAEAGNAEAQLEMGILYEYGFNMEGNEVPALAWYLLAAKQGNQKAAQRRDILMSRMTQPQIEQAQQQSAQLLRAPQ